MSPKLFINLLLSIKEFLYCSQWDRAILTSIWRLHQKMRSLSILPCMNKNIDNQGTILPVSEVSFVCYSQSYTQTMRKRVKFWDAFYIIRIGFKNLYLQCLKVYKYSTDIMAENIYWEHIHTSLYTCTSSYFVEMCLKATFNFLRDTILFIWCLYKQYTHALPKCSAFHWKI